VTTSDSSSLKVLSGASRRLAVVLGLSPLLIFLTLLRAFMLGVEDGVSDGEQKQLPTQGR